ncbi:MULTISPECIES: hypothetical protein [unclassified Rhodanobacter]|uniref:hypothetical protein n=1 Tax=unclassified Rhodanobacter TaxID=2621553 RepID=UPI0007A9D72C|nr:hypothetical protein [Rhodanobacter sp. FW510-R10]KZC32632.1 hypothetical protein RhoFW510R10_12010 [Rhodanobacter sp. FW510-R10]
MTIAASLAGASEIPIAVGETYVLDHGDWKEKVCVRAIQKAGRGRAVHYVPVERGYFAGKLPEREFQRAACRATTA